MKVWEYQDGVLTELPPLPFGVNLFVEGFFPAAMINFYWDRKKKKAYFNRYYAPLYGKGTSREILHEGDEVKLGEFETMIWVS